MLPRCQRVSKVLFETTMKASKVFHSSFFSVRIGLGNEDSSRFSCVVSKKIDKSAVKRNALRRKMYGVLAEITKKVEKNHIVLVFAKKGCELLQPKVFREEIELLLSRAGLLTS